MSRFSHEGRGMQIYGNSYHRLQGGVYGIGELPRGCP
jgi:hypothetical protein